MPGTTLNISMRPADFESVIGLETEVAALRTKIATGKIPRAFIFHGRFGCGKTTLAYLTAREIQGWDFTGTPQVQEVNAASVTGIDAMRKLIEGAGSYPMVGKYGVIILDEAHKLSKAAQEALLKEFEAATSTTVWIICTTEYDKLIEGIRAGRCFTLAVRGLDETRRKVLVERAAAALEYTGDITEFLAAITKAKVDSPRKILMAFEAYHSGIPAGQAVAAMHFEVVPEFFEIAMGVVFGQWEKDFTLPWIKERDGSIKKFKSVAEQLKALDERLKKKPREENVTEPVASDSESETAVDEEDIQGRPDAARALRAIVAASLKNQLYKGGVKAQRAALALFKLAHCTSANPFDTGMEYACTVGGLYEVNAKMQGK